LTKTPKGGLIVYDDLIYTKLKRRLEEIYAEKILLGIPAFEDPNDFY